MQNVKCSTAMDDDLRIVRCEDAAACTTYSDVSLGPGQAPVIGRAGVLGQPDAGENSLVLAYICSVHTAGSGRAPVRLLMR